MVSRHRLGLVSAIFVAALSACGGRILEDRDAGPVDAGTDLSWWRAEEHLGECCSVPWGAGPLLEAGASCPYNYGRCPPDEYCGYSAAAWREGHVLGYDCHQYGLFDGGINPNSPPGKP